MTTRGNNTQALSRPDVGLLDPGTAGIRGKEKCVDFDSQLLTLQGDQYDHAYMQLNPNAVVPTLLHDDKVVTESTVIMHYVDDLFRSHR